MKQEKKDMVKEQVEKIITRYLAYCFINHQHTSLYEILETVYRSHNEMRENFLVNLYIENHFTKLLEDEYLILTSKKTEKTQRFNVSRKFAKENNEVIIDVKMEMETEKIKIEDMEVLEK
jgi:hypothetical protein